jgi:release factor glutamine methyltransferase
MTVGNEPWTVRRLLEWTTQFFTRKQVDAPRLSAELLLSHVTALPRIKLYTNYETPLSEQNLARYRELVKRAGEHEPVQYLTGKAHFFNLEFEVTRDTLIPRPETETLVEHVLQAQRNIVGMETPRILDLCTGSGCIAAAIAKSLKTATVVATELSTGAADVATRNVERLGLTDRVRVLQGDLFAPLEKLTDSMPFDIIVSNPPYIPTAEIPKLDKNVRDYEPVRALDGGPDGLTFPRRILSEGAPKLAAGGRVYIEIAFDQGPAAVGVAQSCNAFEDPKILKDHGGRDRVLAVRKKT